MAIGVIVGIISAIASAASAYQQSEAQKTASKQAEYDAEYEAQRLKMEEEAARMEHEANRKLESRQAEADRRRRIAFMASSGGDLGMSAIAELSRQSALSEQNIQNRDRLSAAQRSKLNQSARNALLSGRLRAGNLRAQSRATMAIGQARAASQGVGGFRS